MQKINRALLSGSSGQCRLSAAWRPLLAPLVAPKHNAVWPPPMSSSIRLKCAWFVFVQKAWKSMEKPTLQAEKPYLRIMRCLPSNGGQRLCSRLVLPYTEHENGEHCAGKCWHSAYQKLDKEWRFLSPAFGATTLPTFSWGTIHIHVLEGHPLLACCCWAMPPRPVN